MDYDEDIDDSEQEESTNSATDDFAFLKPTYNVPADSGGLTCEVKLYEARCDYDGHRSLLEVGKHKKIEPTYDRDHKSALVFARYYKYARNERTEIDYTELTIRSPYLKQALREVIKEYPGVSMKSHNIVLKDLPKCLFHYREELQAHGLTLAFESDAFKHLVLLLQHMWEQLQSQYASYYNLMESSLIEPGLDFDNLWMAFRPGDYLYTKINDHDRVVKMRTMQGGVFDWDICFDYIADNGSRVGFVEGECEIEKYDGYRALRTLKIFPLKYHPEKDTIMINLVARGQKMMSLRGTHYRMYEGATEALGTQRRYTFLGQIDKFPLQATTIKSRVMIDAVVFGKINPSHLLTIHDGAGRLSKIDGTNEYVLTNEQFMICDHQVPGFSLSDKSWCWFDIDKIVGVEFNTGAFEKLLLPQVQKDMIRSLVEVHTNNNLTFDDVIKGKGRGMVFLLHGVPGTGKTLTAESVADQTKRPLYTISSGDLGVQPPTVEKNLKAALDLATAWNAIVLIDEADIFLERRSMHDLERNSLVSIFLRLLEYYEGILILTTNRINSFDTAFKSRIHLAIKYHPLSPEYRATLWKSFIANTTGSTQRLSDEALEYIYPWLTDEYLEEIGKTELNGRQIKNSVRTANALAVNAGVTLAPTHIDSALRAMRMFESDFAEGREQADDPSSKRRRLE